MEKVLLCYSPKGGNVEKISHKIIDLIGKENAELCFIEGVSDEIISEISSFNKIIMIISTVGRSNWDSFYKKIGWDLFIPALSKMNLKDKKIAIIGLGDHLLYPDNFVDSMGVLYESLINTKATIVGKVPVDGYAFSNSKAIEGSFFVGLPIDEDNENELTDLRLKNWLKVLSKDFGL